MPPEETSVDEGALLSSLLKIAKPEETKVEPAATEKPAEKPAEPKVDAKPEAKTEPVLSEKPAEKPAEPAKKAKVVKREVVREEIPEAKIEEIVKRTVAAQKPEPVVQKEELPADLTAEEREELELVAYVEKAEPSKAGLKQKYLKFYADQRKFLEKRLGEEGDDYDPTSDPQYKRWLASNNPRISAAEKHKFTTRRIAEEAEQRAVEKVQKEYQPKLAETQRKLREIEERPKIQNRLQQFVTEVAQGMPQEMHDFYLANGKDINKLKEAFPDEFEIVSQTVDDTLKVADEFLATRHGLKEFNPENPEHARIVDFVDARAKAFIKNGGKALVRGGKTFVHPFEWPNADPAKNWTFDNEDVLSMLKLQAQRDAKKRVEDLHRRIDAALEARKRRVASPKGDDGKQIQEDVQSPKITAAASVGNAAPAAIETDNIVANILKLGSTKK